MRIKKTKQKKNCCLRLFRIEISLCRWWVGRRGGGVEGSSMVGGERRRGQGGESRVQMRHNLNFIRNIPISMRSIRESAYGSFSANVAASHLCEYGWEWACVSEKERETSPQLMLCVYPLTHTHALTQWGTQLCCTLMNRWNINCAHTLTHIENTIRRNL